MLWVSGCRAASSPLCFPRSPFAPPPRLPQRSLASALLGVACLLVSSVSVPPPPLARAWSASSGALPVRLRCPRRRCLVHFFRTAVAECARNALALPPPPGSADSRNVSSSPIADTFSTQPRTRSAGRFYWHCSASNTSAREPHCHAHSNSTRKLRPGHPLFCARCARGPTYLVLPYWSSAVSGRAGRG